MPSGPTYYDFFGVSATASAEQIRSAYLWLMKQHHPDLTDHADKQGAGDYAAILNRSYDVLKDPERRARYDAFLASESYGGRKRKAQRRALLTGQGGVRRERKWDASSKGAAALACMILLLIFAAVWSPAVIRGNDVASAAATYSPDARSDGSEPSLRDQVRAAMGATAQEAQVASERCFASARDSASSSRIEMCIVFDDAYVEWNETSSSHEGKSTYFDPSIVRLRHGEALAAVGVGETRLDQLRQIAMKLLLNEIRAEMKASAASRPFASVETAAPDLARNLSR